MGASGDGRTGYDRVWSPGCTDIDFGSRHDVSDALILNTGEGGGGSHPRTHPEIWVSDATKKPISLKKYLHGDCKRRAYPRSGIFIFFARTFNTARDKLAEEASAQRRKVREITTGF